MVEIKHFDKKGCSFINIIFRKEIRFQEDENDNCLKKLTPNSENTKFLVKHT